ncbi:hypothetical protein [Pseudoalteromonas viridis]|uniref:Uncharacterized protein n=1 Tax=Pseudoalteromonas viridis TaxID=339617 RepID=A0ABX7V481_9GAMM|nr:hypothetical protein [Pseudoalteromonas viridis]QTL35678.1 hypothetical protein J5X90_01055 [Pseudoalteromonas viridis]
MNKIMLISAFGTIIGSTSNLALAASNNLTLSDLSDSLTIGVTQKHTSSNQAKNFAKLSHLKRLSSADASTFSAMAEESSTIQLKCQPTLQTNTAYPLAGASTGGSDCFHFEITNRSKAYAFVLGQNENTDVTLSLVRHNADDTLTFMGTSANNGNLNEMVSALTQPGHYYWLLQYEQADGSEFNFGVITSETIDSFESNDTVAASTQLPDQQNKFSANLDHMLDVDHYAFEAKRGQELLLKLDDLSNSGAFVLEHFESGTWSEVPSKGKSITPTEAGEFHVVRVSPNPNLETIPANQYMLTFGSTVKSVSSININGENNVLRLPYSAMNDPYLTTQAYQKLNISFTLNDSTGHPVPGANAVFRLWRDYYNRTSENDERTFLSSDSEGKINKQLDIGRCSYGDYEVEHIERSLGYVNRWKSNFNIGAWQLVVPTSLGQATGVGGPNVEIVSLGHICKQRLVSSTKS